MHLRAIAGWRALWTVVHRWLGLSIALFLVVAGLTGAVLSWDHELDEWLNSDLLVARSSGPARSPLDLVAAVEAADPRATVSYVTLHLRPGENAWFLVRPRVDSTTGRPYELGYTHVYLDPATGEVRGRRDSRAISLARRNLVPFLRNVHYRLMIPSMWGNDRWGYWLMGGVALVWLFDSFVGLYLTLPSFKRSRAGDVNGNTTLRRWRSAWTIRTSSGFYKMNFDLHRAFGLWTWAAIIVIAFTSFSLNLYNEIFYPVMSLVSKVTPSIVSRRTPTRDVAPPKLGFAETVRIAENESKARGWTTPMGAIYFNNRYNLYNVSFFDRTKGDGDGNMSLSNLYIDANSGQVLRENVPWKGTAADVFLQLQYPLHSGRILGVAGRIAMTCMGLVIAMLSVTGVVIWARKLRARMVTRRNSERDRYESASGAAQQLRVLSRGHLRVVPYKSRHQDGSSAS